MAARLLRFSATSVARRRCLCSAAGGVGDWPPSELAVERIKRLAQYRAIMREARGRFSSEEEKRVAFDEELAR